MWGFAHLVDHPGASFGTQPRKKVRVWTSDTTWRVRSKNHDGDVR
jgi:hypothetical protein